MAEIEKDKNKKEVSININELKDGDLTIKVEGKDSSKNSMSSKTKKKSVTRKVEQNSNNQANRENLKEENSGQKANESEQDKANEMFNEQDKVNSDNDKENSANGNNKSSEKNDDRIGNSGTNKQIDSSANSRLSISNNGKMKLPGSAGGNPLTQGLKKGANGLGNAAKDATKQAAKAAGKAVKEALKKAAAALAKAIATNPYAWIVIAVVVIILVVAILINQLFDNDAADTDIEATTKNIESMQVAINNGEIQGDVDQVNTALSVNSEYGSYLGFSNDQINYLYNQAINNSAVDESDSRTSLIDLYKEKYGSGAEYSDGVLRFTDYRELYKHIMNTEKYNFNEIEWINYNHEQNGNRVLTSDDMKINSELGIRYPNDTTMSAENFMELASPYLLSNYIPLSFLVAQVTKTKNAAFESGLLSNQEILQGIGVDSSSSGYKKENNIAYQILKFGLSDITINQYQLKSYMMDTYYLDYDATDYHEEFDVAETKTYSYTVNSDGTSTSPTVTSTSYSSSNLSTKQGSTVHHNTRLNGNNEEDVKLETVVSENPSYENIYYVTHAKTFDMEKNVDYTYNKYNDTDVTNRTNADSESIIDSEYNETDNEQNKITTLNIGSMSDVNSLGTKSLIGSSQTSGSSNSTTVGTHTYTIVTNYHVVGKTYTVKDGTRYDISREWDDEVVPGNSETKALNVNALIDFNKNEEGNEDKTTIDENILKNHKDYSYYEDLATSKKLNLVDLLDSNPKIFQNYVGGGSSKSEYIGLGRDNIFVKVVYDTLLKKYFDTIADSNKLKLAYGSSLGYDVSSGDSSGGSGSYGTAFGLMIQLLHAFEGGGTVYQNTDGVDCYKVLDVVGHMTVGYGIDITVNPQWKTQLEQQMGTSITFGTLVPCEYVDAIEEDFINRKLASIDATLSNNNIDLKEYQKHALLIRMYNTGNISGFPSAYNSYFKEEVDDRYESTYEQYSSDPGNVSAITSCADLNSELYNNFLSTPITADGQTLPGLVTRRKEEYYLFSLGYYTHNSLHAFYSQGLSFNGINTIKADGSVDLDACYQLQAALEDAVFDGKFHSSAPGLSHPWGQKFSTSSGNRDEHGYLSDTYRSFFASALYYQCPWWSRGRANIYLNSVNSERFTGQFIRDGLGDGKNLAKGISDAYKVPFYTDLNQLTANCVISYGASAQYGHTAYVEAVGNDYYVISHCGSGVAWHGISIVPKTNNGLGAGYGLVGFVKMDDIVSKYNN